jgi:hypothetical protein
MFARKLFTALHYKEFGPPEGGILWRWYSNVQRLDDELPDAFIQLLGGRPKIQRTRRDLSGQFVYTYGKATDGELTGYFATFRSAIRHGCEPVQRPRLSERAPAAGSEFPEPAKVSPRCTVSRWARMAARILTSNATSRSR